MRKIVLGFIAAVLILPLLLSGTSLRTVDAQSVSLLVSATVTGGKFFGPQIVQVVVDGAGTRDPDSSSGALLVNGVNVPLVHLGDGRWYAFIADQDTFTTLAGAANLPGQQISAMGGSFWKVGPAGKPLLFPSLPRAFGHNGTGSPLNPNLDLDGDCATPISDQDACVEWPYIRLFSFTENDQVSFRYSGQSVTLNYVEPSRSDVSISLDRESYPVGAEIILTLADYMWNINPVEEDRVHFAFSDTGSGVFYQASTALQPSRITSILGNLEFDRKQVLDGEGLDGVKFENTISGMPETVLIETVPNSGIFENFVTGADMFANKRDALIIFDYFDISTSSAMATSDASVSVGKEESGPEPEPEPEAGPETSELEEPKLVEEEAAVVVPYSIAEPRLADLDGKRIDKVGNTTPVLVETSITNNQEEEQPFVYILQVKDSDGFTVMLTWIKGRMNASSTSDYGISWIPEQSGTYEVSTFVWESLEDPGLPLTRAMTITVED